MPVQGDTGDVGSIPGLGRPPGEGNSNPLHLPWIILCTEEPGRLQSMGCKESGITENTHKSIAITSLHVATLEK